MSEKTKENPKPRIQTEDIQPEQELSVEEMEKVQGGITKVGAGTLTLGNAPESESLLLPAVQKVR